MKIIGKLVYGFGFEYGASGHLSYPTLDSLVVIQNEGINYGIYKMVPIRDANKELHIQYHPRVTANSVKELQDWIGLQYRIELNEENIPR